MPATTARCGSTAGRCISARPATRWRPASAWSTRSCRSCPALSVAENVFLGHQPTSGAGVVRWRRDGARGQGASAAPRHRRRPRGRGRPAAARPAAAGRARPGAVQRRADHHPGRADLGPVAARDRAAVRGAAPAQGARAPASSSSRTSSRTCWRSPTGSPCSATAGGSPPQDAAEVDKHWLIERMIGRGHRGARGGDRAGEVSWPAPPRRAGRAGGARPGPAGRLSRRLVRRCGPARCWGSTASWARARSSSRKALMGKLRAGSRARCGSAASRCG